MTLVILVTIILALGPSSATAGWIIDEMDDRPSMGTVAALLPATRLGDTSYMLVVMGAELMELDLAIPVLVPDETVYGLLRRELSEIVEYAVLTLSVRGSDPVELLVENPDHNNHWIPSEPIVWGQIIRTPVDQRSVT